MKLTAEYNGEKHQVDFKRVDANIVAAINDRQYEVKMREAGAGVYVLIVAGRVYECRVDRGSSQRKSLDVHIGTRSYSMVITDPKQLGGSHVTGARVGDGAAEIIAPMPGKLVRVLVELGAQVKAGDGIVIVEAMKMQNELKAPRAGKISEIRTANGETVNAGDVLAIIEG